MGIEEEVEGWRLKVEQRNDNLCSASVVRSAPVRRECEFGNHHCSTFNLQPSTLIHNGQALIELALGLLAVSLAVSALCYFAIYMVRSLEIQNSLRTQGSHKSTSVAVDEFAEKHIFGASSIGISEKAVMPERTVLQ